MAIKKIEIKICDNCKKEIKGRLITHTCPCCRADICNKCQAKEDARHKPKPKVIKQPPGKGEVDISTFELHIGLDGAKSIMKLGDVAIGAKTLKEGAIELMAACGIDQEYIEAAPDSEGRVALLAILKEDTSAR